jgi:DNA-binding PadR family transcriptional regulator
VRFSHHPHNHEHRGHRFGPRGGFHHGMRHGGHRGWGERHGDGEGRGGRRRRVFDSSELRLVLLKLIADQPRHGYELIRAIEELSGGVYAPSPGVVYPTLTMLEEMGFIEQSGGEGARKPYQITDSGRAHLEENEEEADELVRRLKALSPSYSAEGGSPIWRAMRNLGQAIRNRVAHGEITEETKFELAALIDELAQKIERLK